MDTDNNNSTSLPVWYLISFAKELLSNVTDVSENGNLEYARGILLALSSYHASGGPLTVDEQNSLFKLRDTINTLLNDKNKRNDVPF